MANVRNMEMSWDDDTLVIRVDTTGYYGRIGSSGRVGVATAGGWCPLVRDGTIMNGWLVNCTVSRLPREGDPNED